MNNEIIELLLYKLEQNYKCEKENYFILYKPDIKDLLDYISNLKQENEKLKNRIEEITKIYQNESKYRTELETKHIQLQHENQKNKKIIEDVYNYLDEKKDVPEWWDTDFFTCMNMLRDGKLTFNDWVKKGDDEK